MMKSLITVNNRDKQSFTVKRQNNKLDKVVKEKKYYEEVGSDFRFVLKKQTW